MADAPSLTFTDAAADMIAQAVEGDYAIRVVATRTGVRKFHYAMDIVDADDCRDDDRILEVRGIEVRLDGESAEHLEGATVDFVDEGGLSGAGFKFENPNEKAHFDDPVAKRIQTLLDERINPMVAGHGGVIELLDYKDGTAFVHMGGGCQGCGLASQTLRDGVTSQIQELVPEVTEVVDGTDHAAGEHPYFESEK